MACEEIITSEEIDMNQRAANVIEHDQEIPFGEPDEKSVLVDQRGKHLSAADTKSLAKPTQQPGGISDLIAMAIDKDLDIDKLERLLEMKSNEEEKTAKAAFSVDMAAVQSKIQPIIADADNAHTGSRYSKLATIVRTLAPIYTAGGFSVTFGQGECTSEKLIDQGWFRTTAELSHAAGHSKPFYVDLPADIYGIAGKVNKTLIHGTKSSISYARVILMGLMFNFTTSDDVDDDGNGAGAPIELITDQEICIINEAVDAKVIDKSALLAFAKVDDFGQIEQRNWGTIHNLIQRKYKIAEKAND